MTSPETLEPTPELQALVESHLRDSLMLRAVMQAEKASLARIVLALAGIPDELHATVVGRCMQRVAGRFVVDP